MFSYLNSWKCKACRNRSNDKFLYTIGTRRLCLAIMYTRLWAYFVMFLQTPVVHAIPLMGCLLRVTIASPTTQRVLEKSFCAKKIVNYYYLNKIYCFPTIILQFGWKVSLHQPQFIVNVALSQHEASNNTYPVPLEMHPRPPAPSLSSN